MKKNRGLLIGLIKTVELWKQNIAQNATKQRA
jgi:hypothetical protein